MTHEQKLSEHERMFWAAWVSIPHVGSARVALLRGTFGTLEKAWAATDSQVQQALQLQGKTLEAILNTRKVLQPENNWQAITTQGIQMVTIADAAYPALLKEIHNAPPVLFYRGTLPNPMQPLVAVVGTRVATSYGKTVTSRIVEPLALAGVGIVSGLALGIDGLAHEAALAAGGKTYAVVGTGLDQFYPPQHTTLADRIVKEGGAIISEFPLGMQPLAQNFPQRNRIVAGMCRATIVVEAGEKSGALLTAKLAFDENREVFCVPGDITREASAGTNKFIALGAQLLSDPQQILTVLNVQQNGTDRSAPAPYAGTTPEERVILEHLGAEPRHVDELASVCDCDPSVINATLTVLELQGHVRHVGGLHYTKS